MKRGIFILLTIGLLFTGITLHGQDIIRSGRIAGICYAGSKINKIFIPPPKEYFDGIKNKGATIKVYYSGFTSASKAAFEHAVSIMSSILPANTSFTIRANWGPLTDNSVLGKTSITSFIGGAFIDALNPMVYYPVALAEKIACEKLNTDEEGDLAMTINSKISWYTGVDGNTPVTMYDLVTVVLHELCHGIGFVDSFNSSNSIGSYGINSTPLIYDVFIEDRDGYLLTDKTKYTNNSAELNNALTGGQLFFSGPLLDTFTLGQRARIYAPSVWDAGSSISHLNENSTAQVNALLTPFLDKGEAIHSPGKLTMSMLGDLGWINTRIAHKPFTDTETALTELTFKAAITSDTTISRDNAGLVYSFNNFTAIDTLFLVPPQSGDTFKVNLTIPSYNSSISYYFFVKDCFGRTYKLPSPGQSAPFRFYVGTDTVKPTLVHTPTEYILDKTVSVKMIANAFDNIGIDTVYIEYRKNTGFLKYSGFKNDSLDVYSGYLDIMSLSMEKGDSVQYRVVAVDKATKANKKYLPAAGFYTIKVTTTFAVVTAYSTDFTSASSEFIMSGFSITQPSQFSTAGLHTKHPYESPDKDNESLEYTAVLRYPVKVDDSGIVINFQEIVLVEPGEPGSVYGSSDFYDYVIVEASRDYGKSWFSLENGYDSRISSTFLNAYNSAITGNNSTFTGTQDMYIKHTIDMRNFDKFSKGDTLLIRFRLYSDPYAHGWGWAIDDLNIKSVAAGVDDIIASGLKVFPNPGNGMLRIDLTRAAGKETLYKVINMSGIDVSTGTISSGYEGTIDLTTQPPGVYIIIFKTGNIIRTVRYTKLR